MAAGSHTTSSFLELVFSAIERAIDRAMRNDDEPCNAIQVDALRLDSNRCRRGDDFDVRGSHSSVYLTPFQ
jgi:hypothetical protein